MNLIFQPQVNYVIRHFIRPFTPFIPVDYLPRVTGRIRVRIDDKHQFELFCNPTSFQAKCLFFYGIEGWEPNAMRIFRSMVPKINGFLDIGANIGVYSLVAASLNPGLRILSFEPSPDAFRFLNDNIRVNHLDNIRSFKFALSDRCGTETFHLSIDPAFAGLDYHLTPTGGFNKEQSSHTSIVDMFEVSTRRLDRFLADRAPDFPVDLVKLDTESSEHLVLGGAAQVLTDQRPVIMCEVLADTIEDELMAIFKEYDYIAFRAGSNGLQRTDDLRGHTYSEKEHFIIPKERNREFSHFIT